MAQVRIAVLSRFVVSVGGSPVRLTPTNSRMLIRLVLAGTGAARLDQLYRDVWRTGAGAPVDRRHRTLVQRQIGELRRILDPRRPGEAFEVILTERGVEPAYRLRLPRDQVDLWAFEDLAEATRRAAPEELIDLASRALALWPATAEPPFGDLPYASAAGRRLLGLRDAVRRRQLAALIELRRDAEGWALARDVIDERPDDQDARGALDILRRRGPAAHRELLRHVFGSARATALVVLVGDIFAVPDADLVVGFTDTFDTSTHGSRVISTASVQGQLLDRVYRGARPQLDRDLRRALSGVPEAGRETRQDRKYGKLIRYQIGTVAIIRNGSRNIFCVAYSRLGNDLVARSTVSRLGRPSTDCGRRCIEKASTVKSKFRWSDPAFPASTPSTIRDLLELIVRSFSQAVVRGTPVCRELRVTLTPAQLERIDLGRVRRLLDSL